MGKEKMGNAGVSYREAFLQVLQYKRKNAEQEAVIDERANDVARLQSEVWLDIISLWYKQRSFLIFCRFS